MGLRGVLARLEAARCPSRRFASAVRSRADCSVRWSCLGHPCARLPRAPTSTCKAPQARHSRERHEPPPAASRRRTTSASRACCRCASASPRPREAGRIASRITLVAVSKTFEADGHRAGHRGRAARLRRKPGAGSQGQVAGAQARMTGIELASHRSPADQQGGRCGGAVRCHPDRRSPETRARPGATKSSSRAGTPELFIEVNTGEEEQKAGIVPREADRFIAACRERPMGSRSTG